MLKDKKIRSDSILPTRFQPMNVGFPGGGITDWVMLSASSMVVGLNLIGKGFFYDLMPTSDGGNDI